MACHNRRDQTARSLRALFDQDLPKHVRFTAYLADDGSTDGTAEAVAREFPSVNLLMGDGTLYWNGAMRLAMDAARDRGYDFFTWLNDDTVLVPNALAVMFDTYYRHQEACHGLKGRRQESIIVGSTKDPVTGGITYGGVVRSSWWHPVKFQQVPPSDKALPCDTMNGNFVLIPGRVVQAVGGLDPAFRHWAGDFDYGFRARRLGCAIWIAPGYLADCVRNRPDRSWDDGGLPFRERWRRALGPKGMPLWERKVYLRRHGGAFWVIFWLGPYVKLFLKHSFRRVHK